MLDGEILNHESLRAHLDYPFRTRGDAEVVLAGLALEGISFVERLRGQFAFVAHDLRTDTTHLVRDRLGILHSLGMPRGVRASQARAPFFQTSRLCFTAASMKLAKSGCGSNGLLFSSGWNWTPTNQG